LSSLHHLPAHLLKWDCSPCPHSIMNANSRIGFKGLGQREWAPARSMMRAQRQRNFSRDSRWLAPCRHVLLCLNRCYLSCCHFPRFSYLHLPINSSLSSFSLSFSLHPPLALARLTCSLASRVRAVPPPASLVEKSCLILAIRMSGLFLFPCEKRLGMRSSLRWILAWIESRESTMSTRAMTHARSWAHSLHQISSCVCSEIKK
jgi:hypothetical protein